MVIALILSGGAGLRMGMDIPKQYVMAGGRPIISYCMQCLFFHTQIDAVQIVAEEMWRDTIRECIKCLEDDGCSKDYCGADGAQGKNLSSKFRGFSKPGENRQLSILNGLQDIRQYAEDSDYVLIHDAARPLLSQELVTDCLNSAFGRDGVIPVLPMKDTVYFSDDGRRITSLLSRSQVYAGQAPEVFVLGKYYEANRKLLPEEIHRINGSTEPAVMAGMDIAMIPGDEGNYKITTKEDLERFTEMINKGSSLL